MPSFFDTKNANTPTRKLSHTEVINALQLAITSQCETIRICQQIAGGTDNADVHNVITDLVDDAMHHAGAMLKLLYMLSPDVARQYEIGAQKTLKDMGIYIPGGDSVAE